jgi:hypothetical protein
MAAASNRRAFFLMIAQLYGTIHPLPSWDDGDDLLLRTNGGVAYRFACSATSRQRCWPPMMGMWWC